MKNTVGHTIRMSEDQHIMITRLVEIIDSVDSFNQFMRMSANIQAKKVMKNHGLKYNPDTQEIEVETDLRRRV